MHPLRVHIEKISPLTDEEFEYILSHFVYKKVRKHQYLIEANDDVVYDFWVMKGCIRSFFLDPEGKEHILQFAIEDWWTTDYNAYFNQTKASINAVCMEDGEVLGLSLLNREKICAELHKFDHFFGRKKRKAIVALQKRILSLLASPPHERYEEFSRLYPHLLQRVPKKYIAAYLGVSRETLSRLHP